MSVTWGAEEDAEALPKWMPTIEQPNDRFAAVDVESAAAEEASSDIVSTMGRSSPSQRKKIGGRKASKFMIPADAVQQLSYVLERVDTMPAVLAITPQNALADLPAGAVRAAVEQWRTEFAATKDAAERRRPPEWDLNNLVNLSRSSPSLRMCKDLDTNMLLLVRELSNLAVWRKQVCEQRLLPLPYFTHFSVVCARLARAKGLVQGLQSMLVSQVRALFVETSDDECLLLHKELLLRRDNQSTAQHTQQEIEHMYSVNDYLRKELVESRAFGGWIRMVLTHEIQALERVQGAYNKDVAAYTRQLKDRTSVKKILSMNAAELGVDDTGVSTGGGSKGGKKAGGKMMEMVKRQKMMLKHASNTVTSHEEQIKLREGKLVHQQEKYREAVQEYEKGAENMQKRTKITESRAAETAALKKRLDEDQVRMETVVKSAHKELADLQRTVQNRFEVLANLETDASHQAHAVEAAAREQLMSLSKHAATAVAKQAQEALVFAYEASAYIKNTKVYPLQTDWAQVVASSVVSPPESPIPDYPPPTPDQEHLDIPHATPSISPAEAAVVKGSENGGATRDSATSLCPACTGMFGHNLVHTHPYIYIHIHIYIYIYIHIYIYI